MALSDCEDGKQAYTLYGQYKETRQRFIYQHAGAALITTDHDAIIALAVRENEHHGDKIIYTVAMLKDEMRFTKNFVKPSESES